MGKKLSELVEATAIIGTDIFHVRTAGGIDKKVTLNNILGFVTKGDLVVRGAAIPEELAAGALDTYFKGQGAGELPIYEKLALINTGIKMGYTTRSTAGDQVILGVGFQPSVVIFLGVDSVYTNENWSIGFDENGVAYCVYRGFNGTQVTPHTTGHSSIFIKRDINNVLDGEITALSGDGFTITWTLTGALAIYFFYLCLP